MRNVIRSCLLLLGLSFSVSTYAADIKVNDAWARATLPGQDVGMASLVISSKRAASLVGITSSACKSVEMHSMSHENNMMKMSEVKAIPLPAGETIDFDEAGYHLMLVGLKVPLKEGDKVPLILKIKRAKQAMIKIETLAEVKSLSASQGKD